MRSAPLSHLRHQHVQELDRVVFDVFPRHLRSKPVEIREIIILFSKACHYESPVAFMRQSSGKLATNPSPEAMGLYFNVGTASPPSSTRSIGIQIPALALPVELYCIKTNDTRF